MLKAMVILLKNCWYRVEYLGSVVIQLYAGECTPSVLQIGPNIRITRSQYQLRLWLVRAYVRIQFVSIFLTFPELI